jgi:hypothetical protein
MIFRIFSATDQKASEYFRTDSNKILNSLRGKESSGLIVIVQSFITNGSENSCVAGSIPALATSFHFMKCRTFAGVQNFLKSPKLEFQVFVWFPMAF